MTRRTNAAVAGWAFLLYIALGIASMVVSRKASGGDTIAAQLATIAQHASDMRLLVVLTMITCFCALALGVTLWAITRDQDPDLAMMGLTCRVAEGVLAGTSLQRLLGALNLATDSGSAGSEAGRVLGAHLLTGYVPVVATFFAVGSTLFCWLLLRGRMIPALLAWTGVIASVLLVVALPLQIAGVLSGSVVQFLWIPMALFEIPVALWFIFKGVAAAARTAAA